MSNAQNTYVKIWLTFFLLTALSACKKNSDEAYIPDDNITPLVVTIDQNDPGYAIPETFLGFSYEVELLTKHPEYLNTNNTGLVQLIKNLGPGILRIGGTTSDEVDWTGRPRTPGTPENVLTTTDIDRVSAFSKAVKWGVIFNLNLVNSDADAAVDEAGYLNSSLGQDLYALQVGNEPDVYSYFKKFRRPDYTYEGYNTEWSGYLSDIRRSLPQVRFAGPDIAYNTDWLKQFADLQHNNVALIDGHYYRTGPASDTSITYKDILKKSTALGSYLQQLKDISSRYNLPYRISECNSVYGGGKAGVSDVFASSLWALDFMWMVAENRGQGINFHNLTWGAYSPIVIQNGLAVARPEYYAMLAFKYGASGGKIIPVKINDVQYNCSAYACASKNGAYTVTIINKTPDKNFAFTVNLSNSATSANVFRLVAPAITSTDRVTFGGAMVAADNTFKPTDTEHIDVNDKSFVVNIPAGSAAVITVK